MKPKSINPVLATLQLKTSFSILFTTALCFCITLFASPSLAQNCGVNTAPLEMCRWGLPYPSCTVENTEEKCIRIIFHFINNTNGDSQSPTDAYFGNLLFQLNRAFKSSKIRFTFEDKCIHRFAMLLNETSMVKSAQKIRGLLADSEANILPPVTDGQWTEGVERHPDMEWTPGYINVYFVQNHQGAASGWLRANLVSIENYPDIGRLVHEIGHTLGLSHTYDNENHTLLCLCNNPSESENGTFLCEITQDCLCDTGIDPWSNDLDGDSVYDGSKWVNNCKQSALISAYADGCSNTSYGWHIPFTNYMSYYAGCRSKFSPCQKSLMHDVLEELEPELITNSCTDLSMCADITVDGEVVWTDDLKEMCPGQKIIIRKTGSLILNNTKITIKDPDEPQGCSELIPLNLWDGIYIEGKSIVQTSNGPQLFGSLTLLNGSIIEFAEYGINAPIRFAKITIDKSEIKNCGRILNVTDPWPFSFPNEEETDFYAPLDLIESGDYVSCNFSNPPPEVRITDSTLSSDDMGTFEPQSVSQLKVSGSAIYVNNSDFINNSNFDFTAINQSRGRVTIVNSSEFSNFTKAVVKGVDILSPCISRGLLVYKNFFNDCGTAIENHSSLFYARQNKIINGGITTQGLSYHKVYGNNISNGLINTTKPAESAIYSENLFTDASVLLDEDNTATDLNCNIWDGSYAVDIQNGTTNSPTFLSMGWGTLGESSGNKRANTEHTPLMQGYQQNYPYNNGNFPHYTTTASAEQFSYFNKIQNLPAQNQKTCLGNVFPMIVSTPDENWVDYTGDLDEFEVLYDSLQNIIDILTQQYNVSTGNTALLKLQQIYHNRILSKDLVGSSLLFLDDADSSIILDWIDRSNPLLGALSTLTFYFYKGAFEEIKTKLGSNTNEDADKFIESIEWLGDKYQNEIDLFSLPSTDLDTLKSFAEASFGDYTNILRSFLHSEYDLYIPWPEQILERSVGNTLSTNFENEVNRFLIVPNPTSNCFTIRDFLSDSDILTVNIFNLNGQLMERQVSKGSNALCLSNLAEGMYVLQIRGSKSDKPEMHLIVKI